MSGIKRTFRRRPSGIRRCSPNGPAIPDYTAAATSSSYALTGTGGRTCFGSGTDGELGTGGFNLLLSLLALCGGGGGGGGSGNSTSTALATPTLARIGVSPSSVVLQPVVSAAVISWQTLRGYASSGCTDSFSGVISAAVGLMQLDPSWATSAFRGKLNKSTTLRGSA